MRNAQLGSYHQKVQSALRVLKENLPTNLIQNASTANRDGHQNQANFVFLVNLVIAPNAGVLVLVVRVDRPATIQELTHVKLVALVNTKRTKFANHVLQDFHLK